MTLAWIWVGGDQAEFEDARMLVALPSPPGAGTPRFSSAVRLANSTTPGQGRPEVLQNGQWLPVCGSGRSPSGPTTAGWFDEVAAAIVCGQLGYSNPVATSELPNTFGLSPNTTAELALTGRCPALVGAPSLDACPNVYYFNKQGCYNYAAVTCSTSTREGLLPTTHAVRYLPVAHQHCTLSLLPCASSPWPTSTAPTHPCSALPPRGCQRRGAERLCLHLRCGRPDQN